MNFSADMPFLWLHFGDPLFFKERTSIRQTMCNGNVICWSLGLPKKVNKGNGKSIFHVSKSIVQKLLCCL